MSRATIKGLRSTIKFGFACFFSLVFLQTSAFAIVAPTKAGEPLYCSPNEGAAALVVNGNNGLFTINSNCYGNISGTAGTNQITVQATQGTMTNVGVNGGNNAVYTYTGLADPNFTGTDTFTIHLTTSRNNAGGPGNFANGPGDVQVTLNVLPSTITATANAGQQATIAVPAGSIAGCSAPGSSNNGAAPGSVFGCVTGASIGTVAAAHGTTVFTPGAMTFKYTPNASFSGVETFKIQALGVNNDGNSSLSSGDITVNVTVAPTDAPVANNVAISGSPQVGNTLTGSYTYASTSGAVQGNSTMRWMIGSKADGGDKRAINGATSSTYSLLAADGGNYLFYCVTPVALTGVLTGVETCSSGLQFVLVPNITSSTAVTGIGPNQLAPLDLTSGYGPTLTNCLMNTVRQLLGQDAVYLGQVSGGGTRVMQGGKIISFYVVRAGGDASQGSGLRLLASNALNMGTSCGNADLAPALYNPTEFGAALAGLGLSASINATGVITITGNGSVYVARPDYFVTPGQSSGAGLKLGADGLYRFTDSAGYSQVLRGAFISIEALQASAASALGGTLVIQTDGTALFTQINGQQWVLSPDLVLGTIPAASASLNWWTDGPNHYRFAYGFASQGLTLLAK